MIFNTNHWFSESIQEVETYLKSYLAQIETSPLLKSAMQYATLNGGKRLRALFVLASAYYTSAPKPVAIEIAVAIEMIHAYSLVHDDLPAMDDDQMRRGKPTCHIQFNEATAILCGDALLTESFRLLSNLSIYDSKKIALIQLISAASGPSGMVGGQQLDLLNEERLASLPELEQTHRLKTGALIQASILAGVIPSEYSIELYSKLAQFADIIGLAFQVKDDILDVTGTTEELGKTAGRDQIQQKSTYVALLGLEGAQKKLEELYQQALSLIEPLGDKNQPLLSITHYILERNY